LCDSSWHQLFICDNSNIEIKLAMYFRGFIAQ
jgi:hypothetical protein